jgi:type VI secretion system protein ImpE
MQEMSELIDAGDLSGAIQAMNAEVKQHPADTTRRALLAELLCFAGDLERGDRLLDVVEQQDTSTAVGVALFRQLIRAEEARQQFYSSRRLPDFLEPPADHDQLYLKALVTLQEGDAPAAARLLAEAENDRIPLRGKLDGTPFDDFRDLDDIAANHFDVLTSTGKFYWVPMRLVERITLHSPKRRRDFLWRRATIEVAQRPDGEVFLPTIYPAFGAHLDDVFRLGRRTDFLSDEHSLVRGRGLRSFLAGDNSVTALEINSIEFSPDR